MKNQTLTSLLCTTLAAVPEGVIGEIETTDIKMKFDKLVIRGAQIFDSCDEELMEADVLVSGLLISAIGDDIETLADAFEINAEGYTPMPRLVDAHRHGIFAEATVGQLALTGEGYWNPLAAEAPNKALSRGFTSVRDTA